ncbi:MAG: hypothetical protein AUI50_02820 [Crenarchaeota archaeon 13_1_40CM_2_52_14]|nr:MAG: hypothetical protein AUI97_02490 [Crenarchaeota archaeon 13_1_40CM_3_52_17]OLD35283.1 MAG: hypothetical protein AUI50_02820 [Crenarchaeota archaeon 13_1_40CM_2_52_14]
MLMTEGGIARLVRHPLSPFKKRAFFSIVILGLVMAIGTIGMMVLEGWDLVTSFYFMSLLATAEGPAQSPMTVGGKIFASFMAFLSIGAAISAITFAFGPLFGSVVREGFAYVEREEDKLKTRLERKDKAHSSSGPES